jgi:hypothetical protein
VWLREVQWHPHSHCLIPGAAKASPVWAKAHSEPARNRALCTAMPGACLVTNRTPARILTFAKHRDIRMTMSEHVAQGRTHTVVHSVR